MGATQGLRNVRGRTTIHIVSNAVARGLRKARRDGRHLCSFSFWGLFAVCSWPTSVAQRKTGRLFCGNNTSGQAFHDTGFIYSAAGEVHAAVGRRGRVAHGAAGGYRGAREAFCIGIELSCNTTGTLGLDGSFAGKTQRRALPCQRGDALLSYPQAGVVQWQYRSFPSFGRGFDSHRPLQILKHLHRRLIFHIFRI